MASFGLSGHYVHMAHRHISRQNTHAYKIKPQKFKYILKNRQSNLLESRNLGNLLSFQSSVKPAEIRRGLKWRVVNQAENLVLVQLPARDSSQAIIMIMPHSSKLVSDFGFSVAWSFLSRCPRTCLFPYLPAWRIFLEVHFEIVSHVVQFIWNSL